MGCYCHHVRLVRRSRISEHYQGRMCPPSSLRHCVGLVGCWWFLAWGQYLVFSVSVGVVWVALSFPVFVAVFVSRGGRIVYLVSFFCVCSGSWSVCSFCDFFGFLLSVWFAWVELYSFLLVGGVGSVCRGVFMWLGRVRWWVSQFWVCGLLLTLVMR